MDTSKRLPAEREEVFPNLFASGYSVTSMDDCSYNCIAWAAGDDTQWWTPFALGNGYYWPDNLEKNANVDTFVKLYGVTGGYSKCDSPELEPGFEKIVLYVGADGEVTHAARQKGDCTWTSKLGDWEDIGHKTADGLSGDLYGKPVCYLKRPIPNA